MPRPKVLGNWDISNHFPVVCSLLSLLQQAASRPAPRSAQGKRARIHRPTTQQRFTIIQSNYWAALAEDAAKADAELDRDVQIARIGAKSKAIISCCHAIAEDLELHQAPPRSGPPCVPRSIGRIINSLHKAFC
jgi:hypothetical protein